MLGLSREEKIDRIIWAISFFGLTFESEYQRCGDAHLGAVLADTVLQSGINYRTVVEPRVRRIMARYPDAVTLPPIVDIVRRNETGQFLMWNGDTKIQRFANLVEILWNQRLRDIEDTKDWIMNAKNCELLLGLPGIGPKTVDYLKAKLGIPAIPIDRHLLRFATCCGVRFADYVDAKNVFCSVSQRLDIDYETFDLVVWNFMVQIKGTSRS